jgi:ATPase family AAA domain-containing protein 2
LRLIPIQAEYNYQFEEEEPPVEVTEAIVEVQALPNGDNAMQVVQETITETAENGHTNGVITEQHQQQDQMQLLPPPLPPRPKIYDMDLERMHSELYRDKYLTPDDFLDDVRKIVHNANVYQRDDPDRFYKAQAMYTATELSCQDFDPQFRLECQRMAGREHLRREERKQKALEKEKERQKDQPSTPPNTRRSARQNGSLLELQITDPVRLERQLKRQRSHGASGSEHEEEANGVDENGEPLAKRTKTQDNGAQLEDERDPLDIMSQATPQRQPSVLLSGSNDGIATPTAMHPSTTPPFVFGPKSQVPDISPLPPSGFDPHLLNPAPDAFLNAGLQGHNNPANAMDVDELPQLHVQPPSSPAAGSRQRTPLRKSKSRSPAPVHEAPKEPTPPPPPRSPTPVYPDFYVDSGLLEQLKGALWSETERLTVEQLEQLRAMLLAAVWRHRQEWNRNALVRELQDTIGDFVQQVHNDASDSLPE